MFVDVLRVIDGLVNQQNTSNETNESLHRVLIVAVDEKIFPDQSSVEIFQSKHFGAIVELLDARRRSRMNRERQETDGQFDDLMNVSSGST